jgi:hypothetical protein
MGVQMGARYQDILTDRLTVSRKVASTSTLIRQQSLVEAG